MNPPKVSVMVSVYNSERFLTACLDSLRHQTFTDFEAIIVDGGSKDTTPALAQRFQKEDSRFRFLPADRFKLIAEARADALAACRGTYVAILDSDDIALPSRLQRQVEWLEQHPGTALLSTYYRVINDHGWPLRLTGVFFKDDIDMRWRLTFGNCLTQSTLMFRKETALKAGGYDRAIRAGEDMDFYSRIMGLGRLDILPEILNIWRWHSSSLSHTEPVEYKTDFMQIIQFAIQSQLGLNVNLPVVSALFNQSRKPASTPEDFREALVVTKKAWEIFSKKLYDPERERQSLGRSAFLQLADLYTKNRSRPWWPKVSHEWRQALRDLKAPELHYRWWADGGLFGYYRKIFKSEWRFFPAALMP